METNNIKESTVNVNNTFWIAEYQKVSDQFAKYLELYLKTFILYIGVNGFLLKFAFDKNSTDLLFLALSKTAILVEILMYISIILAWIMTKKLIEKRSVALEHLGERTSCEFITGYWASIVFAFFNTFVLAGWSYFMIIRRS